MIKDLRILPRGGGKTTAAIELAKTLPNCCVVVATYTMQFRLHHLGIPSCTPEELRGLRYDSYIFDDLFYFKEEFHDLPLILPDSDNYIFTSVPKTLDKYSPWFSFIYANYPEELI
jgi:hypothetical protein